MPGGGCHETQNAECKIGVYRSDAHRTKAPSDEGAGTAQAVTEGEKTNW